MIVRECLHTSVIYVKPGAVRLEAEEQHQQKQL
jgi:hypothetical protein